MKRLWVLPIVMGIVSVISAACSANSAAGDQAALAAPEQDQAAIASAAGLPLFNIVPAQSEASFTINEVLAGSPKTVVGTTQAVGGSLVADFKNPANTTVGTIHIDMSTLQTDNNMRNRAIHDMILQTGNAGFQYAEFTPTVLHGLPETIVMGQPFSFQMTGNLTIHGVTREETFDVTVTPVSATRLEGTASLQIQYSDFGINILRLPPQVASVADEVTLALKFVAVSG